jgi:hypothetical protein
LEPNYNIRWTVYFFVLLPPSIIKVQQYISEALLPSSGADPSSGSLRQRLKCSVLIAQKVMDKG